MVKKAGPAQDRLIQSSRPVPIFSYGGRMILMFPSSSTMMIGSGSHVWISNLAKPGNDMSIKRTKVFITLILHLKNHFTSPNQKPVVDTNHSVCLNNKTLLQGARSCILSRQCQFLSHLFGAMSLGANSRILY